MRTPACLAMVCLSSLALLGCAGAQSGARAPSSGHVVPLQRVRLYEVGVGFFERRGEAKGTSLPVPASHLDDALKTLVLLGADGAPVRGVSFPSRVSGARARARMGLPTGTEPLRHRDLLASLRGERVRVTTRDGARVGTLIDVVDEQVPAPTKTTDARDQKPDKVEVTWVSFLGDAGELSRERLDDLVEVRPLDPAFAARLESALSALSPRHALLRRDLSVLGDGDGQVAFGYVAEAPVWRASYRVVLDESAHAARIQGWALVHNDTDEDWRDVRLELASGRPDSFLFPLAAPRYRHRQVLGPDESLSTLPQLGDATADALWGELGAAAAVGGVGHGYGMGSASHSARSPSVRMGATSISGGTREGASELLSVGNLREVAKATADEELAQSVFKPDGAFSLGAQRSLLVPIVSRAITAEPLVSFAGEGQQGRTAVRLTNTVASALPAGTLAVFGGGGLLGEALLERLPAGESRMITLGDEVDVELRGVGGDAREDTKKVVFRPESGLAEHFLRTTHRRVEVENRGSAERAAWLALGVADNATVDGADRVVADATVASPHAVLTAPPRSKKTRTLTIVEGLSRTTATRSIDEARVRELSKRAALSPVEHRALGDAATSLAEESKLREGVVRATADRERAEADLARLRQHLTAVADKAGGAAPLVKRVLDAEARLDDAAKRAQKLEEEASAARQRALASLGRLP
ncbi:MAG: DUF4139 domain-containing protein [Polyangiaceae bacterium]|nr:DUF4139 domain-containing protein [Polyangiaceae bacterium]